MKKIGNIVTNDKIDVNDRFNVVISIDDCIPDIPTLIFGYYNARTIFPDTELIINDRKFSEILYWTFTRAEMVRESDSDLELFINLCYKQLETQVKYFFIDSIHLSEDKLLRTYEKLKNTENMVGYLHNDRMIYMYGDGIIFGLDLELSKFVGIDPIKVQNKFSKFVNGLISSKTLPDIYLEDISHLNGAVKYVPYLYFLDKTSNII
jgi:hypothetical protein